MRFALIASGPTPTNDGLTAVGGAAGGWERMTPHEGLALLRAGDVALGRLDVLPTLDGIEDGLWALGALRARGVTVLNEPAALLAAHDKLLTARLLRRAGVRHARTWHVRESRVAPPRLGPLVVKPRFGSWGRHVHRCDDRPALVGALAAVAGEEWFRRHGALVQELVPPQGYDLRVLVAAQRVVGAVYRLAAPGEWRTNIALGGVRRDVPDPPHEAARLAVAAARAIGADLVGVDLLPDGRGGWVVAEVNGAVEFTREYAPMRDVFCETAGALTELALAATLDPDPLAAPA